MSWLGNTFGLHWDYESIVTAPIRAYNATIAKDTPVDKRNATEILTEWTGGAASVIGGTADKLTTPIFGKLLIVIAVIAAVYFLPSILIRLRKV